ncbi:UNVERIFIED_CONTAM: hypothetical protein HDU68_003474 [Siphonaria sp. JEL0065]|nr:hypothetical protein HDU68_003474 [Siphonaria sp. JEL0065]
MGMAVSGTGFGGLVFSILSQRLLDAIGREWTLRVTATICLVLMSIFVPFMKTRIPPQKGKAGMSFLKNPGFYCLLFACFFGAFCEFVPVYFISIYAETRLGLTKTDGSVILSIYNGMNMVGRLALGLASDRIGPMNSMMACTWLTVICIFSWLATSSFAGLCTLSAAIGFFDGGFWTLFPIAVVELCGADGTLISMMAILYTFMTIAVFGTPPLSGFIKDAWGLEWMIVYAGGLAILAAMATTGARFVHGRIRH